MNLNMLQPKIIIEHLQLSVTKNCGTLIKQTHTKPQETIDFNVNKSIETFLFNPPVSFEGSRMIGLTNCEVYISFLNINSIKKIEFITDNFDEFSFEESKDELKEILKFSVITPYHLQHEEIGPRIIEAYKKSRSEKSSTDGYVLLLMGYARCLF